MPTSAFATLLPIYTMPNFIMRPLHATPVKAGFLTWLCMFLLVGCSGGSASDEAPTFSGSSASSSASSSSTSSSSSSASSSSSSSSSAGPLTTHTWRSLTGAPLSVPLVSTEWSTGQVRGIKDNVTGDLLVWFAGPGTAWRLLGSQDNGATWNLVAADVTNPGGSGYVLMGVAQDSAGNVHALAISSDSNRRTVYLRFSLVRSGGHVTGHTIVQAPIQLPARNNNPAVDMRGDIKVIRIGGNERIVWCYQPGLSPATAIEVWAGISTVLNVSSSSELVGMGGTGGDTLVFSDSGNNVRAFHLSQTLIVQNPNNENLYFINGQLNGDYAVPVASDSDNDLIGIRYTVSGSAFMAGSTTTIASDNTTQPFLIGVDSDGDKAWVMYMHPSNGVSFGYFNTSGTFVAGPASPLGDAQRTGFGAFSARGGKIWSIYHTYAGSGGGVTRTGRYSYWNGSAWTTTTDSGHADNNGMAAIQWNGGVSALRWTGILGPQQQDDVHIATLYGN